MIGTWKNYVPLTDDSQIMTLACGASATEADLDGHIVRATIRAEIAA